MLLASHPLLVIPTVAGFPTLLAGVVNIPAVAGPLAIAAVPTVDDIPAFARVTSVPEFPIVPKGDADAVPAVF
jgi:hypothetical protein